FQIFPLSLALGSGLAFFFTSMANTLKILPGIDQIQVNALNAIVICALFTVMLLLVLAILLFLKQAVFFYFKKVIVKTLEILGDA
ncbi:MAG TPA: hypothetical protein VN963_02210, partial [bacterium]|nr:hypothetical protein [bacterium]